MIIVLLTKPPWDGQYIALFDGTHVQQQQQRVGHAQEGSDDDEEEEHEHDGAADDAHDRSSGISTTTTSSSSRGGEGKGAADLAALESVFAKTGGVTVIPKARLRMVDVVGSGATATVYKASWNGTTVALKIFYLGVGDMSRKQLGALAREVRTLAALNHPNVAPLLGVTWTAEGQLGFVSEFVDLGTLRSVVATMHRDMQWSLRLRMALDVARGMAYLHSVNVLHRALRSSNVLVTKVFRCKLTDVGLLGFTSYELADVPASAAVEYTAPEVLRTHHAEPASDVYSFGVLLAELAAGHAPFSECSLSTADKRRAIESGKLLVRPSPACPRPVADLILECTCAQPSERPSFVALERRLEALRGAVGSLQEPFGTGPDSV